MVTILMLVSLNIQVFWGVTLVTGQVVTTISKDHSPFVFLGCLTLKTMALWSSEMFGTRHPTTQCHIPEDLHLQGLIRYRLDYL
jgi:hypothetical protein